MNKIDLTYYKFLFLKNFLSLFLLLLSFSVSGQKSELVSIDWLTSEQTKIEKGLSQNSVYSILQDKNGFMWFGTWDGLNRYDGINVRIFNVDFENPENGLPNQTIKALCEDLNGNLWVGTEKGLCQLSGNTPGLSHFLSNTPSPQLSNDTILSLLADGSNNIWIGTANKLNVFYQKQDSLSSSSFNFGSTRLNVINDILFSGDHLFLATQNGLIRFNTLSHEFDHLVIPSKIRSKNSDTLWCLAIDNDSILWVGADRGLYSYNLETETWTNHHGLVPKASIRVMSLFVDRSNQLWVGTAGKGIKAYYKDQSKFVQIIDENDPLSAEDFVYDIYEDQNGNIWYGSAWKGVAKANRSKFSFTHLNSSPGIPSSRQLNNNKIWSIIEIEKNVFWIATDNGINIYDRELQKFKVISKEQGLLHRKIRYLLKDSRDKIWISYYQGGVSSYDIKDASITHYPAPSRLPTALVWSLLEDNEGNIWISTEKGLYRLDPEKDTIKKYRHHNNDETTISHDLIYVSYKDRSGQLWFGTQNGLNQYNRARDQFRRLKKSENFPISINKIFSLYEDKNHIMWIGTIGGGLNKYDPKSNQFEYFTQQKNGLANNVIYGILEDNSNNLWLTTNDGLSQFIPSENQFINFNVKDGIQGSEFNLGAYCKTHSGEIIIGGMNGVNVFRPEDINKNMEPPYLVINSFSVMNEEKAIFLNHGDTIELKHSDNFFEFGFAALDYTNPSKNIYSYRLQNFDNTWKQTGIDKPYAEYTKVDPGTYVFQLKGTNSDGIWNEEGLQILVIIKPPWYNTLLFKIIAALLLGLLIWFFIYRRILALRKKHQLERQMIDLERQSLRLQMNPHFIFNTLYSIQGYILENKKDIAVEFLAKFSKLMRLVLNNSNQDFILISDEIEQLKLYLDIEQERFDDCFDYKINIDKAIDDQSISIPPMLIQPYAENSIIHGFLHKKEKGQLEINFSLNEDMMSISIKDDGVGRKASASKKLNSGLKHESKGMLITKKRLEILNKKYNGDLTVEIHDLYNEKKEACGTEIKLNTLYLEI